jgi:hypothetical protein
MSQIWVYAICGKMPNGLEIACKAVVEEVRVGDTLHAEGYNTREFRIKRIWVSSGEVDILHYGWGGTLLVDVLSGEPPQVGEYFDGPKREHETNMTL